MKVVQLKSNVDKDLIDAVEALLAHVKAGNIAKCVIVAELRDPEQYWRHNSDTDVAALIGLLEFAKIRLTLGVQTFGDDSPPKLPENKDAVQVEVPE